MCRVNSLLLENLEKKKGTNNKTSPKIRFLSLKRQRSEMYKVDARNNEYVIFLESLLTTSEEIKVLLFIDENSRSKE